eukprot:g39404.t1
MGQEQAGKDVLALGTVQGWFTRLILGIEGLSYEERLRRLSLYSSEFVRMKDDLIEAWRIPKGLDSREVLLFRELGIFQTAKSGERGKQEILGKEEINNMKTELEKYGIQMPAFSKIGGILANELSVDEAALHAAVIAINDAIEKGVPAETLAAMKNPNAMLVNLDPTQSVQYQDTLSAAKHEKMANARNKVGIHQDVPGSPQEERDVYEELLTQAEIQGNVNKVN